MVNMKAQVDLHVHTTASDGTLSPGQVVALAKQLGLKAIAITDHDTVQGVKEAVDAGLAAGIQVISGVEISVDHQGSQMHILGYFLDITSHGLLACLDKLQGYREERNPKMARKLQDLGFQVTIEEAELLAGGDIVGRPHFATLLVQKGYVATNQEAFNRYLAYGKPAYVAKRRITPREGIKVINGAGGIAVLAHPGFLPESEKEQTMQLLLRELKADGLQGLEVYYSEHTPLQEELFLRLASAEELLVTGGSDFHGKNKSYIALGSGCSNLSIPYEIITRMERIVVP